MAFVGKSGGGKSTLIHLLMRFYDPTAGQITLDGLRLSDINLRSLHMNTGLVAQDTQLFGKNIEENIACAATINIICVGYIEIHVIR